MMASSVGQRRADLGLAERGELSASHRLPVLSGPLKDRIRCDRNVQPKVGGPDVGRGMGGYAYRLETQPGRALYRFNCGKVVRIA